MAFGVRASYVVQYTTTETAAAAATITWASGGGGGCCARGENGQRGEDLSSLSLSSTHRVEPLSLAQTQQAAAVQRKPGRH